VALLTLRQRPRPDHPFVGPGEGRWC